MAIHMVLNKETLARLFAYREETFIVSYRQGHMGKAYADDARQPRSAVIVNGGFCFFAGVPNRELIRATPGEAQLAYAFLVPPDAHWEKAIEFVHGAQAKRHLRYATKKEPDAFDAARLREIASRLSEPYESRLIDRALYERIVSLAWARDLCANYASYPEYRANGLGVAIMKNGEIVAGASSYLFYNGGIEVEIDTREDERRKGLALICGARLILECLEREWYPSWDAYSRASLALAEKLGYRFDREYTVYEIDLC